MISSIYLTNPWNCCVYSVIMMFLLELKAVNNAILKAANKGTTIALNKRATILLKNAGIKRF